MFLRLASPVLGADDSLKQHGLKETEVTRLTRDWKPREHSPGHRNTAVPTGEHAALLLRVDHGWNCQGGGGVHDGPGSAGGDRNSN